MSSTKTVALQSYRALIKSIQSSVLESKNKIERTYVSMYWTIGRCIDEYIQHSGRSLPDGTNLFTQLSGDLQVDTRTLYQTHDVYRAYPKIDSSLPISWSHYRYLAQIKTKAERVKWERVIVKQNLSVAELKQAFQKKNLPRLLSSSKKKLSSQKGLLYHYRIIKMTSVNQRKERYVIDCGFDNHVDLPQADGQINNTRIVRSVKEAKGYTVKLTKAATKDIYTYVARVQRVVDGDTLLVYIDCGFGIHRKERLRLKGIDAPERNTLAGQRAKSFVESELKKVNFVIIKSYWEDPFARYIADVFFDPKEKDPHKAACSGIHLNQLMLDQGLAKVY